MHLTAKKEKTIRRIINYVVFMGPAVLLFVVIGLIPFFYEIWYSFTNWDGIHANYQFVGLMFLPMILNIGMLCGLPLNLHSAS